MKTTSTLAFVLAGLTPFAQAQYFFDKLVINGRETKSYEFVRQNSRAEKYMPTKFKNSFDNLTPMDTDFRCNLGATRNGAWALLKWRLDPRWL